MDVNYASSDSVDDVVSIHSIRSKQHTHGFTVAAAAANFVFLVVLRRKC